MWWEILTSLRYHYFKRQSWEGRDDKAPSFNPSQSEKKKQALCQFDEESESDNSRSTSSSPQEKGVNNSNLDPTGVLEHEEGDVIQIKDLKVHESIRWKVEGAKKHFYDGLKHSQNRPMKRPIVEEYQLVTSNLHEYPDLGKSFNEYELEYLSKPLGSGMGIIC